EAPFVCGGRHTQRNRNQRCDEHCGQRQLDRRGVARSYTAEHRLARHRVRSPVAPNQPAPVVRVLRRQRLVQTQLGPRNLNLLFGSVLAYELTSWIARHDVDEQEDQRYHRPQHRNDNQQSSQDCERESSHSARIIAKQPNTHQRAPFWDQAAFACFAVLCVFARNGSCLDITIKPRQPRRRLAIIASSSTSPDRGWYEPRLSTTSDWCLYS